MISKVLGNHLPLPVSFLLRKHQFIPDLILQQTLMVLLKQLLQSLSYMELVNVNLTKKVRVLLPNDSRLAYTK
ncbi:hypothetical protein AV650_23980 [Serratia fonticola]|nr:hypothetical protein AV650_23980 [Serratia fonticola]